MYLNRTICDVLREMRKSIETLNFSYLAGLVEEAQSMANRMEAALADAGDIKRLHERRKWLNKEVQELRKVVDNAKGETDKDSQRARALEDIFD